MLLGWIGIEAHGETESVLGNSTDSCTRIVISIYTRNYSCTRIDAIVIEYEQQDNGIDGQVCEPIVAVVSSDNQQFCAIVGV